MYDTRPIWYPIDLHALYSLPIAGGIYRTATTKKQKKIVNITFLPRCGASLWRVTLSRHYLHRLCPADYGHIMTSFSKPELHNVLRRPLLKRRTFQGPGFIKIATYTYNTARRQKTITPRPPATRTENLAKPGCVISEICKWTQKQTGRQTDRHAHHNTPLLFGSRVMKKWKTDIFTEKKRSKYQELNDTSYDVFVICCVDAVDAGDTPYSPVVAYNDDNKKNVRQSSLRIGIIIIHCIPRVHLYHMIVTG